MKTHRFWPLVLVLLSLSSQRLAAQIAAPAQKGMFDVGLDIFDAASDESDELTTVVWYPIGPGTEGNRLIYSHRDFPYESPFLGGVLQAIPSSDGPFPLIVLSHGDNYLWWADKDDFMLGRHGGLHREEMLVPLLAARL